VLERCVFRHRTKNVLLIADAYQGSQIRQAIVDFLKAAAREPIRNGRESENATLHRSRPIALPERSDLVVYVGHEGLMDFSLPAMPQTERRDAPAREAIVLACVSTVFLASVTCGRS